MPWSADSKAIFNQFDRFTFNIDNALSRINVNVDAEDTLIPKPLRMQFVQQLHVAQGHLGKQRLQQAVRQRAYWPGWTSTIDRLYRTCRLLIARHLKEVAFRIALRYLQ